MQHVSEAARAVVKGIIDVEAREARARLPVPGETIHRHEVVGEGFDDELNSVHVGLRQGRALFIGNLSREELIAAKVDQALIDLPAIWLAIDNGKAKRVVGAFTDYEAAIDLADEIAASILSGLAGRNSALDAFAEAVASRARARLKVATLQEENVALIGEVASWRMAAEEAERECKVLREKVGAA